MRQIRPNKPIISNGLIRPIIPIREIILIRHTRPNIPNYILNAPKRPNKQIIPNRMNIPIRTNRTSREQVWNK